MKVIIDISKQDYNRIKSYDNDVTDYQTSIRLYKAVKNGEVVISQNKP